MADTALRRDETIGLSVAVVLHIALAAALLMQPEPAEDLPKIERVAVSLADETGLQSTAPQPVAESRAPSAPTLSDQPVPIPLQEFSDPIPAPRPVATQQPRPRATSQPRPQPTRTSTRPTPRPRATSAPERSRPDKPASRPATRPAPAATRGGASRIGDNFLPGAGDSATSSETRVPASQIGASAKASLLSQITRELRPNFDPPTGVEIDKLISVVAFRLNADGSLSGSPRLVRQTGVTDSNRPQSGLHGERALRAVQLAAPFDLPSEYHEAFKSVTINFDASL